MAPTIKYYYFPMACSAGPQTLLEDAGLPYEAIKVDIRDPASREEYTKTVNPKCQVPSISIDGMVVTEIPAIFTAIAQLVPEKNYTGATPKDTLRFYEWVNYIGSTVHVKSFGALFASQKFVSSEAAAEELKAQARESAKTAFAYIEEKLKGLETKFVLGDYLTGVDAYLTVVSGWAKVMGLWDEKAYPSYAALVGRVSELEAWGKVMKINVH